MTGVFAKSDGLPAASCDVAGRLHQNEEIQSQKWDSMDDGQLASRIASGDRQAAEVLILRYQAMIRAFLLRLTGRSELADDLAQDTFVRVLRYADRFDQRYSMKTWLLTIARRLSINHARNNRRQVVAIESWDSFAHESDSPHAQAAGQDEAQHRHRLLNRAMEQLTAVQREVTTLFYQQEQTIHDIAHVMQIPEGTVKSHLHRARASLKKMLAELESNDHE